MGNMKAAELTTAMVQARCHDPLDEGIWVKGMKMDGRFILQAEVTRKADRFDVRGEQKGGTRIILRCCV